MYIYLNMWSTIKTEKKIKQKLLEKKPKPYNSTATSQDKVPLKSSSNKSKNFNYFVTHEKPDGGWGWLVVLGVAISNMTTQSLISVFGLLFLKRLEELNISTGGASIIMGVQTTISNLSGLIIGPTIKKFSYRKTSVAGALMVVSGLLLTMYGTSIAHFVFSYSLFTGLGLGLLYPSTFVAINSYFSHKRGRAVGLSLTGTGIGQTLLPLLIQYLLEEYKFKGTLLILSGLALHSLVGATLYQPVKWHMKQITTVKEEEISEENGAGEGIAMENGEDENKEILKKKKSIFFKLSKAMNMELMTNLSFANLVIGLALVYTANMCFAMLFPFFLESIGNSTSNIAFCMSVLSGADIIGRLIVPIFTDGFKMKSKTVLFVGAGLSALARSALVWCKNFTATLILASFCGIVRAALVCNFNLCISEQTSPEKLPSALGLHMLFKAIGIMAFAPVTGFIRDYTKSYSFCIHILNVFLLAGPFCAWLVEFLWVKRKHKRLLGI